MPSVNLTKTVVTEAKPGGKDAFLWDEKVPGFGLKVTPAGAKVFIYQYRLGGRGSPVRRYTIGKFVPFTVEQARKRAEDLAHMVRKQIDPQREKVETARRNVDLAFKPYVERFAEGYLQSRWRSSHRDGHALLLNYAVPILGNRPITDIQRSDVRSVIAATEGKVATAHLLFAVLRRMFRWAVNEGDLSRSPMEGMEAPPLPTSRDRVLADAELVEVWRATEQTPYPFGPMVRLLILTGARRDEIACLDWAELDRTARIWKLPPARAKNNIAAMQPLSELAIAELDSIAKGEGWPTDGLVFTTTGKTAVSGFSKAKARLDKLADLKAPWRLHDLRRTVATGLQRLGVRFEVTEAVLNHVSGARSGVAGIYQRHDWANEKATALQAWADHVAGLLAGEVPATNVVQISEART